jgi:hypothetical protein
MDQGLGNRDWDEAARSPKGTALYQPRPTAWERRAKDDPAPTGRPYENRNEPDNCHIAHDDLGPPRWGLAPTRIETQADGLG